MQSTPYSLISILYRKSFRPISSLATHELEIYSGILSKSLIYLFIFD